jgi:hypothetical protein
MVTTCKITKVHAFFFLRFLPCFEHLPSFCTKIF